MDYLREELHSIESDLSDALEDYSYNSKNIKAILLEAIRKFPEYINEFEPAAISANLDIPDKADVISEFRAFWKNICTIVRKSRADAGVKNSILNFFNKLRLTSQLWEYNLDVESVCDEIIDKSETTLTQKLPLDTLL